MNSYIPIIQRKVNKMTELSVCIGSACHLKGSYNIIQTFQQLVEENGLHEKINFKASFCMKKCNQAGVNVDLNGEKYNIAPEVAREFFYEKVVPLVK